MPVSVSLSQLPELRILFLQSLYHVLEDLVGLIFIKVLLLLLLPLALSAFELIVEFVKGKEYIVEELFVGDLVPVDALLVLLVNTHPRNQLLRTSIFRLIDSYPFNDK